MREREALDLVLEAFEEFGEHYDWCHQFPTYAFPENYPPCNCGYDDAITAIKEALAQPEQEPVAWLHTKIEGVAVPHRPADLDKHPDRWEALYKTPSPCPTCEALARTVMLDQTSYDTTPPQRTWVGLTPQERDEINEQVYGAVPHHVAFHAAIEAKLKEKNT